MEMVQPEPNIILVLDMPPGVNKLYKAVRTKRAARFVKSNIADEWANYAKYQIELQRQGRCMPLRFTATITLPKTLFDTDAPIKQIFDACQHGGAVKNDRFLRGFTVWVDDNRPGVSVLIELQDTGERITDHKHLLRKRVDQPSLL